jgi:hypothetical protein
MRKALIAVIVASALFAVGAFAADFTLTAEDTASGADAVDACTDSVTVEFTERFDQDDTPSNVYVIDTVDLTIDTSLGCDDADVQIVLQDDDDSVVATIDGTWTETDLTQSFDAGEVPVSTVWRASVLFDGQNIAQS